MGSKYQRSERNRVYNRIIELYRDRTITNERRAEIMNYEGFRTPSGDEMDASFVGRTYGYIRYKNGASKPKRSKKDIPPVKELCSANKARMGASEAQDPVATDAGASSGERVTRAYTKRGTSAAEQRLDAVTTVLQLRGTLDATTLITTIRTLL